MSNYERLEPFLQEWGKSKRKSPATYQTPHDNGQANSSQASGNYAVSSGRPPLQSTQHSAGGGGADAGTARPIPKQVRFAGGSAMEVEQEAQQKN